MRWYLTESGAWFMSARVVGRVLSILLNRNVIFIWPARALSYLIVATSYSRSQRIGEV